MFDDMVRSLLFVLLGALRIEPVFAVAPPFTLIALSVTIRMILAVVLTATIVAL